MTTARWLARPVRRAAASVPGQASGPDAAEPGWLRQTAAGGFGACPFWYETGTVPDR
ncbi:MAG: hypothetical protein ACLQI7_22940 [Streptosporangiaceae bacterium]